MTAPGPGAPGRRGGCRLLLLACLVVTLGTAAAQVDDRTRAREAADRRAWPQALALFEQLVAQHPTDVELLIEAARVHGYADRNAAAARLYRQALVLAPQRRAELRAALAWQSLWAGQPAAAEALFREQLTQAAGTVRSEALDGLGQALQAQGDQAGALAAFREADTLAPGQRRLQQRLALSWLWNGDEARAAQLLQQLVQQQPGDREGAWSLANARNFSGAHHAALAGFAAWPTPSHPGERVDLARAWRWAGFEERALPLLADATDSESVWLRDHRVRREVAPYAYATVERAEDRDHLVARGTVLGAGWHPVAGATVELQARESRLRDGFGAPTLRQLQALGRMRLGEPGDPWGVWWPTVSLRVSDAGPWQTLLPSLRLTGVPRDHWRVDLESTRELVEAPRAVANRVTVDVWSAGVEHRPAAPWQAAGSLALQRFDDGTQRARVNARAMFRPVPAQRLWFGVEALWLEHLHGAADVDRGYWNPGRYQEARALLTYEREWRPVDLQLRLGLGTSREVDAAGRTSHGRPHLWELGLGWDVAPSLRVRLAAGGSGAGLGLGSGGSGYWRRYVNLSLNAWF